MRLNRSWSARPPMHRARVAGVGLAALGALGLGLAALPACGGGGATGENAVHLQAIAAPAALAAGGVSVAANCGGGGSTGDN